ncbi:hypothetical protein AB1Y20_011357 [Prymnesium parvum]|uniref:PWWP domain-containing protein n=1 Tax=Prymnesium parvum TaxID=97485 RepID=A0AB34IQ96_PRYPA
MPRRSHAPRHCAATGDAETTPLPRGFSPGKGEVVLALVGKHKWWPALVDRVLPDQEALHLYFFGDHKQGAWRRSRTRPFSQLDSLSSHQRPKCPLYALALSEARSAEQRRGGEGQEEGGVPCGCGGCDLCIAAAERGYVGCAGCAHYLGRGCLGRCVGLCRPPDGEVSEASGTACEGSSVSVSDDGVELCGAERDEEARFLSTKLFDGLVVPPSLVHEEVFARRCRERHEPFTNIESHGFSVCEAALLRAPLKKAKKAKGALRLAGRVVHTPARVFGAVVQGHVLRVYGGTRARADVFFPVDQTVCSFKASQVAKWVAGGRKKG